MTEHTIHEGLTWALLGLAGVTWGALLFVTAPYGRHGRGGWGPPVSRRVAWVVMESPAALGFALIYGWGTHAGNLVPQVLLGMWLTHYVHRAYIYPFRSRSPGAPWPLSLVVLAFAFQSLNAYLNARWISELASYPNSWLLDPRFAIGLIIFMAGLWLNLWSDARLRALRARHASYSIPRGGAFELVSCPNYLGEILEWVGWAVATWSLAGAAFAAYTLANLGPRASAHHRWYRKHFPDYPTRRRALLPYIL